MGYAGGAYRVPVLRSNIDVAVGFIVEIDGNGAVLSGRFGGVGHVASPCRWQSVWMRHGEHSVSKHQGVAGARGRYHLIRWNLATPRADGALPLYPAFAQTQSA